MPIISAKANEADLLSVMGNKLRFICRGEVTGGAWSLMETSLTKGSGAPPHYHDWDEAYYVLEGAVEFDVDEELLRAEVGDFAYIPAETVHSFRGASDAPARML